TASRAGRSTRPAPASASASAPPRPCATASPARWPGIASTPGCPWAELERLPFRRLVSGPPPAPDPIFFTGLWVPGHNTPGHAELLPRLGRLDRYQHVVSDVRVLRGVEYRALRWTRPARYRLVLGAAGRRYGWLFTDDNEQIPHFPGRVVTDVDDPKFTD